MSASGDHPSPPTGPPAAPDPRIDQAREHFYRARALLQEGEFQKALELFQRASELAPQSVQSMHGMGACYRELGDLEQSIAAFRRTLALVPNSPMAHQNLAVSLQDQGKLDEAIAEYQRSLELDPMQPMTHSNLLLCMNYHEAISPQQLFEAHRAFARLYESEPGRVVLPRRASNGGRIRVGYLSPDFRGHSVAFFIWPVLNRHDRARFEVTCYSDVASPDALTNRLKIVPEHWCDSSSLSDDQLAARIAEDGIDILVDLAGHTPSNRMPFFARRAGGAPIQVTYLGYPNTTGLSTMDYRISDCLQDPPGMTEAIHSEKLVRLPSPLAFFTMVTIGDVPDVAPPPAMQAASGQVTFAVFTNFVKVRPTMMKLWARILGEVMNSRLVIQARSLRDRATRDATIRFFQEQGIAPERLELREYVPFRQYMAMHTDVDIVLDTFPFNGHTTTCQALWMGVPVVTLAGEASRSRMGASVLRALALDELVAQSEEEYVRLATELAGDLPRLARLRGGLRDRMTQSRLFDRDGFVRALEAAYEEMIGKLETNG